MTALSADPGGPVGRYRPDPRGFDRLTPREHEVVMLIAQGFSNHEIAEELFLSINSIKTYVRSAYRKIGVTRRSQAVIWGMTRAIYDDLHSRPPV